MFGKGKSGVEVSAILEALRPVLEPDLNLSIVDLSFIKDVKVAGATISFTLEVSSPATRHAEALKARCRDVVGALEGVTRVDIQVAAPVRRTTAPDSAMLPGVKNIIAVASGKGGVGKSTTAANLAVALGRSGARVGLLDADVYGPSLGMMFGLDGQPEVTEDRKILPHERHGVRVISMSFFTGPNTPVIWRGPMVHGVLQQFLKDVEWGELDYLVVDLPPGTGDAQLSLSQAISISGAVIVTTPQDVSLLDARKGLLMFRQLKVPVLGIVENMSYFLCPHCSERTEIFRHGGGRKASAELGTPFLGEVPIESRIPVGGDAGIPIVAESPDNPAAVAYAEVASRVGALLARLASEGGAGALPHAPILPQSMKWK